MNGKPQSDGVSRIQTLADDLRQKLAALPRVTVHDLGEERCGIVTFRIDGHDEDVIKAQLAQQNINVTVSTRYSTRLDMEARGLEQMVRASVHYYNTFEEIDRLCAVIAAL